MSVEKLRLMCLVWPNKPDHVVEVELDNNRTVAILKDMIKDKHAHSLADVDSHDFVLWKSSSLPGDDNLEQTLKSFQLDGSGLPRPPPTNFSIFRRSRLIQGTHPHPC